MIDAVTIGIGAILIFMIGFGVGYCCGKDG